MPITDPKITMERIGNSLYFKIPGVKKTVFFLPAIEIIDATGTKTLYPMIRSPSDMATIAKISFFKATSKTKLATEQAKALERHNETHYIPSHDVLLLDFHGKPSAPIRFNEKKNMLEGGFAFGYQY